MRGLIEVILNIKKESMLNSEIITIIIPAYNSEKYIEKCIQSCIDQTYKYIDILIINDGSIDNTYNIISRLKKIDNRIRIINKENEGLVKARKIGIHNAVGSYIIFVDSDDIIEKDAVSLLMKEKNRNNSDIVLSNFFIVHESGKILYTNKNRYIYGINSNDMIANILSKNVAPTIWGKLIKKSLLQNTDTPDYITIGEDVVTLMQIYSRPLTVSYIDNAIYHYIQRPSSMVNSKDIIKRTKRLEYLMWVIDFIKKPQFKNDKNISTNLDKFIAFEYFCLLKEGGNPKDFPSVSNKVNTLFNNNYHILKFLGYHRLFLIWIFSKCKFLAEVYRYIYITIRNTVNYLRK